MGTAVINAIESPVMVCGVLSCALAGVALVIDQSEEISYIELQPDFEEWAIKVIETIADSAGYEVMPEWECPVEELPSGAVRHMLVEKEEVVHDGSSVETV